ncbi:MAG TPA: hypothetical protein VNY07_04535 [Chthoniobacterales bacterium]|jgi:hypothetical protein|nr:hypothetical protein [Chthoniobacterales bacterium]
MSSQTTGLRVAAIVFGIFALGHAARLYTHAKVIVAGYHIPMEASWVALVIAGVLCIWLLTLSSARGG